MEFRSIAPGDEPALARFFARIPEGDRTFLKEDVDDARVIADWSRPGTARVIAMFRALGFEPEALLADHVRDRAGEVRDLMVLANDVESQFASMGAAGITEQL